MNNTNKVLLFTAHPDDHLICAGTLMWLKDQGFELEEVVATGGEKGPWFEGDNSQKVDFDKGDLQEVRREEISKASQLIGISKTTFLGLPDSAVKKMPDIVERLVQIIRQQRPAVIFTHNPHDYHSDHIEVSRIVLEAAERAMWTYLPELGQSYKVPIILLAEGFYFGKPHILVDITDYQERKNQVVDVYASQIYPRERDLLTSINRYRGFFLRDHNKTDAECFEIPPDYPIDFRRLLDIFASRLAKS